MKKIFIFLLIVANLFGYVYNLNSGWNLVGFHSNDNVKNIDGKYKIVWINKNGKWYAYSPDENILNIIKNSKFGLINDVNYTDGIWFFTNNNFNFVTDFIDNNKIKYNKGWNLVSLPKEGNISTDLINNILYVWVYRNGKWYGYSTNEKINDVIKNKYNLLKNINDNEGFWIYANNDGEIDIGKNYYAYFYFIDFIDRNKILPLKYQLIKDNFGNKVGYTNNNGRVLLTSPAILKLSDDYSYLPIVMDYNTYNYVSLVSEKEKNITEIYVNVFDIGDFRKGKNISLIEAKIPPKVFLSFDENYGFVVKKFTTNTDITIAVEPEKETNKSVLGAMKIELEDSLGNSISQDEAKFSGEFQIYMKSNRLDSDVIVMQKNGNNLKYISDTYYLNGKYYSKKNINSLGEFVFVKTPKLYIHKLHFNVHKAVVIDNNLNSYVFYKTGEFKSPNKEENITVFADDFKTKKTSVENEANITLQPETYITKCLTFKNPLTGKLLNNKNLTARYGNEILNLKINNGKSCFTTDNNLSVLTINDINYTIDNNTVYYMPLYLDLKFNAVSYSDLNDANFTYFIYNTTAGAYIYNLDNNKTTKLNGFVYNALNGNIIADISDNIYKITDDGVKKSDFSKDDFFSDIGYFVFSPVKSKDYYLFPTTKAKIILTDLDGNNAEISPINLKTYDNNKTNDIVTLYDINDSYAYATVDEGLVYLINKNTKKTELIKKINPLNYYKVAFDKNLYVAGDKIYKINDKNISVYLDVNASRIFKTGKYFIADNKVYINKEYSYSFDGVPLKVFLINNNLIIVTQNAVCKNNKKILTFNEKIVNVSLKNGYFLIEFENGKIDIFKEN